MVRWLSDSEMHVWRTWLDVTAEMPRVLGAQLQGEAGLSYQDYEVLVRLQEVGPGGSRILPFSEIIGWERSRLSHHLARMTRRGLVERRECGDDARGAIVAISELGSARLAEAAPGHVAAVRAAFIDVLDERDLADLDRILGKLDANLRG